VVSSDLPVARAAARLELEPSVPDFLTVFRTHCNFAWRALRSFGVDAHALDDALQEVFIVVHRRLPEFEARSSLKTWIYAITYRVAQAYRRRSRQDEVEELAHELPAPGPSPFDIAARAEASELVLSFLEGLSDAKRDVFVLCVLEELSVPEASNVLGVGLNTVYSRLRLVREDFKRALSAASAGGDRDAG
jgi:RNA polymerase sigma-70 factor, ECF subfamily